MATLKSRIDQLEARVPDDALNFCTVVHGDDCAKDREAAIAVYENRYGCAPVKFIDVLLISPMCKGSRCGCPTREERAELCAT